MTGAPSASQHVPAKEAGAKHASKRLARGHVADFPNFQPRLVRADPDLATPRARLERRGLGATRSAHARTISAIVIELSFLRDALVRLVHALDPILKIVAVGGQELDDLEAAARPRSTEDSAGILDGLSNRVLMSFQRSSPLHGVMSMQIGTRPALPGSVPR